jgi:hypothetical protein
MPSPASDVAKTPLAPPAVAQRDPRNDPDFGLTGEEVRRKQQERGQAKSQPTPKPQPLVARVTKVQNRAGVELTVELDNGQVWRQTDGSGGVFISPNDTVTITPGAFGGFLLTNADRRVVRVKRIL